MAAHPILIVGNGVIEIPEELREDPRLQKGSRLRLVSSGDATLIAEAPVSKAKADWRSLEGILAGAEGDATVWKQENREWELAHDERKFGSKRPSW
jgi:hypothetical protein